MQLSPELTAQINMWRRKAIEGSLSPEEMRNAIDILRADRRNAAAASAPAKRKAAVKAIPSADSLLGELKGL